jgi:hypothetical protein
MRIERQEIRFDIRKTWHRMNLSIRFPFVRCLTLVTSLPPLLSHNRCRSIAILIGSLLSSKTRKGKDSSSFPASEMPSQNLLKVSAPSLQNQEWYAHYPSPQGNPITFQCGSLTEQSMLDQPLREIAAIFGSARLS